MLHAGTATALIAYFWRDWWGLARGVLGFGQQPVGQRCAVVAVVLIVIATIPAVIVGFALEKFVRGLFGVPAGGGLLSWW